MLKFCARTEPQKRERSRVPSLLAEGEWENGPYWVRLSAFHFKGLANQLAISHKLCVCLCVRAAQSCVFVHTVATSLSSMQTHSTKVVFFCVFLMRVWVEGAWRGSEWIAFLLAEPLVAFLNCGRSSQVLGRLHVRVCMYLHLAACKSVNLLYVLCELESELLEEQNRACRMKKTRQAKG